MNFKELAKQNPCYPVFGAENIKDRDFFEFVEKIISSGVRVAQLREKNLDAKIFYENAVRVKKICEKYNCKLIINDRVDIAMAVNADGVHIGQSDLPYRVVREILGYGKIIGLSLDFEQDIEIANDLDVDYVAVNGVFHSSTKDVDRHVWGVDGIKIAAKKSNHPIVAIGGINSENITQISGSCDSFAVVSDICNSKDPITKINELNRLFLSKNL